MWTFVLPSDPEFRVIEKRKHKTDTLEMLTEWHQIIANKFETIAVLGDMIKEYKGYSDSLFQSMSLETKTNSN